MNCSDWPEPIVRVQSLSESGCKTVPDRYIRPENERPAARSTGQLLCQEDDDDVVFDNIPMIDLAGGTEIGTRTRGELARVCKEWGFFQLVNHGVSGELMDRVRETWREFFHLPMSIKQKYANNPITYEGYGSRLGVQKGAILDWSDYFFLQYNPSSVRTPQTWPSQPSNNREVTDEYLDELVKLGGRLMRMLAAELGIDHNSFYTAFGGDNMGANLRVNFYPKCPQPDLTLGLSHHSDPGGLTILLPDPDVPGLQVRKAGTWVTVKPVPHSFIVNIGDQLQVVTNAVYKSVEHRVIVNSDKERLSLAFFYNPRGDIPLEPTKELVTDETPALYQPMSFNEYRLYIRTKGPRGKEQVDSLKSPR